MHVVQCDPNVRRLAEHYVGVLSLPTEALWLTTSRQVYREWLGRLVPSSYGGAYCFHGRSGRHAVLVNLERIDTSRTRAVEVVVAEELIHMRDHLDGDRRRHAHHGYDRIAHRVAQLTGASLDEIRSALLPVTRRPLRYIYSCPGCGMAVRRRRKGTWSCGHCAPTFSRNYVLRLVRDLSAT